MNVSIYLSIYLPATSYDWSTVVAATSSPAPERAMSSSMFSVLRRLSDCGDEGSDSQSDAPFVDPHSRRAAKRQRSRQQQQRSRQQQQRQESRSAEGNTARQQDVQRGVMVD